ncbi:MAG: hypothetical protein L0Y56_01705 [Nitrospira sp.]|nr:hypothetical protein [Nitrospira sp.]
MVENIPPFERGISDIPLALRGHPKLEMYWKFGTGALSNREKELFKEGVSKGLIKFGPGDFAALDEYLGPVQGGGFTKKSDPFLRAVNDVSIATFGTLGGLAGTPGGPGGVVAGGALGASFGDAFFNNVTIAMEKIFGPVPGGVLERGMTGLDIAKSAAAEGILDASTAGLLSRAPAAKEFLKRKILGITPAAREFVEAGTRLPGQTLFIRSPLNPMRFIDGKVVRYKGVLPLPLQISNNGIIRGWPVVLGRIPFIGTPIKRAIAGIRVVREGRIPFFGKKVEIVGQQDQIKDIVNTLPGRISSNTMTDPRLAEMIVSKAENFDQTLTTLTSRQIRLNELGEKFGAMIEMPDTTILVNKWIRSFAARRPGNQPAARTIKLLRDVRDVIKKGKLTLSEWNQLTDKMQKELENINWVGGKGADEIVELLEAARTDLVGTPKIGVRQASLDRLWEDFLGSHEIAVSKKLMLMNKNVFKETVALLQSKNPDALVQLMLKSGNPQFIRGVRTVVGDDAVRELSSRFIDITVKKSMFTRERKVGQFFDPERFERLLGFNDKKGFRFASTIEMLRGTGVTERLLDDLIKVAKVAATVEIPDTAMFVARKTVLGGARGTINTILGASVVGGGAGAAAGGAAAAISPFASLPAAFAFTLLMRKGSKVITNPTHLKLITTALDGNANKVARRSAIIRVMGLLAREEEGIGPTGEFTIEAPGAAGLGGGEDIQQFMR